MDNSRNGLINEMWPKSVASRRILHVMTTFTNETTGRGRTLRKSSTGAMPYARHCQLIDPIDTQIGLG